MLVRRAVAGDKPDAMIRTVLRHAADLALPPRCPGCGTPVAADGRFCAACWGELHFLGPPWCAACHLPFDYDRGPSVLCAACRRRPPRHRGASAAVAYGPIARRLALKLKYGGRMGVAETMAALMVRHLPGDADLVVAVPLHRSRIWSRGYNQAALIAAAVARHGGVPWMRDALVRTRRTPVLRAMSGRARADAVAGAFAVAPAAVRQVKGRQVVLIDDVYTSGATVDACTAVLLGAGAAGVGVLCWARVLHGGD